MDRSGATPPASPSAAPDDLAAASLRPEERRMIERLVPELRRVLGDDLLSVWLYGSRARGEDPHSDSDIDLLVVAEGGRERWSRTVHEIAYSVAVDERTSPAFLSIAVYDPEYLAERRRIESFFIQEVDRDKIVLAGRP